MLQSQFPGQEWHWLPANKEALNKFCGMNSGLELKFLQLILDIQSRIWLPKWPIRITLRTTRHNQTPANTTIASAPLLLAPKSSAARLACLARPCPTPEQGVGLKRDAQHAPAPHQPAGGHVFFVICHCCTVASLSAWLILAHVSAKNGLRRRFTTCSSLRAKG